MGESTENNSTGFADALEFWQENQLRILVVASLAIQWFLFVFAPFRQRRIPGLLRLFIWLAFLGSDAVAIYALATLFNSHRCDTDSSHAAPGVELLWAPIMLVHLGGQDSITAYNIEDNELWRRHVVTAVSQVVAAIYVFVKTWPPKPIVTTTRVDQATLDRGRAIMAHNEEMKAYARIFTPALFLFFCGITKCVCKPWDLKRVSVNSLVDSSSSGSSEEKKGEESEINSLQDYVGAATQHFDASHGRGGRLQQEPPSAGSGGGGGGDDDNTCKVEEIWKPYNLCVDLAPPYSGRLRCLKHLTRSCSPDAAHRLVKSSLSATFHQLYTKESLKLHDISHFFTNNAVLSRWKVLTSARGLRTIAAATLLGAIAVFYSGGGADDRNPTDVTITYALLWSALVMEYVLPTVIHHTFGRIERLFTGHRTWPDQVAQYNLLGYVARSRKHSWLLKVAAWLGCGDMVDQLWTMKPCKGGSSKEITGLVHGHVASGWMEGHIAGVDSFRAFNDYRGQWTLGRAVAGAGVGRSSVPSMVLMMSVSRPFDESVLVWHLATDFCFHLLRDGPTPSAASGAAARRCREMSNYMAYLLLVKPEMLMPGARRSLFRDAFGELVGLLDEGRRRPHAPRGRGKRGLAHKVAQLLKKDHDDGTQGSAGGGVVRQAWSVAEELMDSHGGSEEKMWSVIQGVWVEMLCFSASRCKGYLHAKSLGTGGEYLSYVWLLLLYMGMETLAEKMQRTELYDGPTAATSSISGHNV